MHTGCSCQGAPADLCRVSLIPAGFPPACQHAKLEGGEAAGGCCVSATQAHAYLAGYSSAWTQPHFCSALELSLGTGRGKGVGAGTSVPVGMGGLPGPWRVQGCQGPELWLGSSGCTWERGTTTPPAR